MDKRRQAVAQTRQRIVEATLALHDEQGVLATSWEEIAEQAGVSPSTVYRYFPSLDELLPACGALTSARIRPPDPDSIDDLFTGANDAAGRIARLVQEWCAFYARGEASLATVHREQLHHPALEGWLEEIEAARETYLRAALEPLDPDDETTAIARSITSFPVWKALVDNGVDRKKVDDVIAGLVLCRVE